MKKLVVPAYSICASRSNAAAECSTGRLLRFNTLLKITASRSVQLRLAHKGNSRPCAVQQTRCCVSDDHNSRLLYDSLGGHQPSALNLFLNTRSEVIRRIQTTNLVMLVREVDLSHIV